MSKINSWVVTNTHVIHIDGKPISIDEFPDDIKFDIETYDKYRQEYLDILYQKEKQALVVTGKLNEIMTKIKKINEPKTELPIKSKGVTI